MVKKMKPVTRSYCINSQLSNHHRYLLVIIVSIMIIVASSFNNQMMGSEIVHISKQTNKQIIGLDGNNYDSRAINSGDYLVYKIDLVYVRFVNGSVSYNGQNTGTLFIRIEFYDLTDTDARIRIHYSGAIYNNNNGTLEQSILNATILMRYSLDENSVQISNGSLGGTTGIFGLFQSESWLYNENFTISKSNITTLFARHLPYDIAHAINVMNELQIINDYNCTFYDPYENHTDFHFRSYDSDTNILLEAPSGFADPILLGSVDILTLLGRMTLIDTSFDLGPPVSGIAIDPSIILAISGIAAFAIIYYVSYKAQMKRKKTKTKSRKRNK